MKKTKQILAIIGIILLVGLYIITLIAALTSSKNSGNLFLACIYATVVIPVLIWAYTFLAKLLGNKDKKDEH